MTACTRRDMLISSNGLLQGNMLEWMKYSCSNNCIHGKSLQICSFSQGQGMKLCCGIFLYMHEYFKLSLIFWCFSRCFRDFSWFKQFPLKEERCNADTSGRLKKPKTQETTVNILAKICIYAPVEKSDESLSLPCFRGICPVRIFGMTEIYYKTRKSSARRVDVGNLDMKLLKARGGVEFQISLV